VAIDGRRTGPPGAARLDADPAGAAPDLFAYLRRAWPELLAGVRPPGGAVGAQQTAIVMLRGVEVRLRALASDAGAASEAARAADLVAYACERLAARHPPDDAAPAFPVQERLRRSFSLDAITALRPVRGTSLRIVEFAHDVTASPLLDSVGSGLASTERVDDLSGVAPGPVIVLFHRSPALIPCEMRIDRATRALLELCDGSRTTIEVVANMGRLFGASEASTQAEVSAKVSAALRQLHRAGTIVFGEFRASWGWLGGARAGLPPAAVANEPQTGRG
jgi:hypothetical protein